MQVRETAIWFQANKEQEMRHKKKGRALNRTQSHRKWLLSNLITSLFLHEKIRTTIAKAKEARPLAEKLITFAKRGDLHARRQVLRIIRDKEVVRKLFDTLGIRYKDRPGGYTRIVRIGNRLGDNSPIALFELIPEETSEKAGGRKRRRRSRKKEAQEVQKAAEAPVAEETTEEIEVEDQAAGPDETVQDEAGEQDEEMEKKNGSA